MSSIKAQNEMVGETEKVEYLKCELPEKTGGYWVTPLHLVLCQTLSLLSVSPWFDTTSALSFVLYHHVTMVTMGRGSTTVYWRIRGWCRNFCSGTVRLGTSCHNGLTALPHVFSRHLLLWQVAFQCTWHSGRYSLQFSIFLPLNHLLWLTV